LKAEKNTASPTENQKPLTALVVIMAVVLLVKLIEFIKTGVECHCLINPIHKKERKNYNIFHAIITT